MNVRICDGSHLEPFRKEFLQELPRQAKSLFIYSIYSDFKFGGTIRKSEKEDPKISGSSTGFSLVGKIVPKISGTILAPKKKGGGTKVRGTIFPTFIL